MSTLVLSTQEVSQESVHAHGDHARDGTGIESCQEEVRLKLAEK